MKPIDLPFADLDHQNAFMAAYGLESCASSISDLGKYEAAANFLAQFAAVMYEISTQKAEAEGVEPKPVTEQLAKMDAAQKRLLN